MEIHQIIFLGEIHQNVQHFKHMSKKMLFTGLGGLVIECEARARIFKPLMSPRIDCKESTPPAHTAWQASATPLFVVPAHHTTQTGGIDYRESTSGPTKV